MLQLPMRSQARFRHWGVERGIALNQRIRRWQVSEFWRRWLIMAAGVTGVVGLAFAGLAAVGATGVLNTILDGLYLPGELAAPAGEAVLFAIGVMGAVMVGWATMMLILLSDSNASSEPAVWRAFTVALLAWFFVDGIVTVAVGAPGNLVLNTALLALYAPALIATRRGRRRAEP